MTRYITRRHLRQLHERLIEVSRGTDADSDTAKALLASPEMQFMFAMQPGDTIRIEDTSVSKLDTRQTN